MVRLEYFLVCKSISIDVETNEISIFHILEDIFPVEIPFDIPELVAVSSWLADPEDEGQDFQAALKIIPPGESEGKEFFRNFTVSRKRMRALHGVKNIPLTQPGKLVFQVLLNGQCKASHHTTIYPPEPSKGP